MRTIEPVKSKIKTTYKKYFSMTKPSAYFPHRELVKLRNGGLKMQLCMSKIDEETMCEFEITFFFLDFNCDRV